MDRNGLTPPIEQADMEIICRKLDFYGLNLYNELYDNADEQQKAAEDGSFRNRPELHLEAVYDMLHMLAEDYISPKTAQLRMTARNGGFD